MADKEQNNIRQEYNNAVAGLNLDQTSNQIPKGKLTYALNAAVENFDGNSVNYQNEPGNEFCVSFPEGYRLIGTHFINEMNKHIFFITNPSTGGCQIGYMDNNDCQYKIYIDDVCLGFDINFPIHKVVHKITNCSTEIYWADNVARRFLDLNNIPYKLREGADLCSPVYTQEVDCNQLRIQPTFDIPILSVNNVISGGNNLAGVYQFAIQYSDALGNPYTSYYSVTNPTPLADVQITSPNFNYPTGKSIVVDINNLDVTGQFQYFNLAVIKTINAISSVELIGTFFIDNPYQQIIYTGQNAENIRLSIDDIFEKFPYYDKADDITTAQDILIWQGLTAIDRINYQEIANNIHLQWETWRIPATENYSDELNAATLRGYLRDEVYSFEFLPISGTGKQYDGFHIPGRVKGAIENTMPDVLSSDEDFIGTADPLTNSSPYWKIYNTASVTGYCSEYSPDINYKGPYQYGEFAYWESVEQYPCNQDVWGELAGTNIRHHKFPDVSVSPIQETKLFTTPSSMMMGNDAIFPIGVRVDSQQIQAAINSSHLTDAQKADIVGFKILRGDRSTNKSIVAKGILRNVNKYEREEKEYYFPNYPYNDLRPDPFINDRNNAYSDECQPFDIKITALSEDLSGGVKYAEIQYTDCNTAKSKRDKIYSIGTTRVCSVDKPIITYGTGTVSYVNYDLYKASSESDPCEWFDVEYEDITDGIQTKRIDGTLGSSRTKWLYVVLGTVPVCSDNCDSCGKKIKFQKRYISEDTCAEPTSLPAITEDVGHRLIFNSPETSFGQPFLGNILKLESVIFGAGKAHFTEVKDNAKYKLVTKEAQKEALDSSAQLGGMTEDFNGSAMFAAYEAYLTIYINGITRKNYAYSFNSIADYNYTKAVPNELGIKQRNLDIAKYLTPTVTSIGDDNTINNYQRESSVFLKTDEEKTILPFPDKSPNMLLGTNSIVSDYSRFTISEIGNCNAPGEEEDIRVVSYYGSLKNEFVNQWGQIYSYQTIDTGFEQMFNSPSTTHTVFGGDTYISRFAFKTKLPFFIDNRVGAPDDSDIFYDEIGNVAYPKYWHSSRSILEDYSVPRGRSDNPPGILADIISYKAHNFDCPNDEAQIITPPAPITGSTTTTTTITTIYTPSTEPSDHITYYDGYFYLFAYGVPNFYCESSYNTDLRQAYNNKEGDFWPHVSDNIPDDWVQEKFVSIANDNTYYYNTTYSKQNKENFFTHIPPDWEDKLCFTYYPFRAMYSDVQSVNSDNKVNAWRTYRANSYFDFPQNYGKLTSLDGIQNRAVLARFENKTLLYNNLLTIDTSNPQATYVGNPVLFKGSPPIDFAETDLGYVGTQNKLLLKIPQGQISVDAKRGQVFLLSGTEAVDMSASGSGLYRFFTDHLAFEILKWFPDVDIDNNFNGIGLHGVFDSKYNRIILTKIDYVPIRSDIKYDAETHEFYTEEIITTTINDCGLFGEAFTVDTCLLTGEATQVEPVFADVNYGLLYNWYAVTDVRNITSEGEFVVPSTTSWRTLLKYLGGYDIETIGICVLEDVATLKETGDAFWTLANGTNILHFNARGSGLRAIQKSGFFGLKAGAIYHVSDKYIFEGNEYICYLGIGEEDDSTVAAVGYAITDNFIVVEDGGSLRLVRPATEAEQLLADGTACANYTGNDGKIYRTVKIGTQVWTADNLAETKFRNSFKVNYGALYNWYAATDVRKITSSDDWRIPISAIGYNYIGDIPDLVEHLSTIPVSCTTNDAAKFLKTTGTEFWIAGTGLNSVGFNAKGTGRRTELGEFSSLKKQYFFWSTSAIFDTSTNKSALLIGDGNDIVFYTRYMCAGQIYNTNNGLPVRLIRNATTPEQLLADGTYCDPYVGNDGKLYRTVKIGTQVWLADNLAETKFRNGDWIHGFDGGVYTPITNEVWAALTTAGMCYYDDLESNAFIDDPTIPFAGVNGVNFTDVEWSALITPALCAYNNDWNNV